MIFSFGERSAAHLDNVVPSLQRVAARALSYGVMDFSVIESIRSKTVQNNYYDLGKSKVRWPDSKHNIEPPASKSSAYDIVPYVDGMSWNKLHCCVVAGLLLAAAFEEGVILRWGGNWDMDGEPITDQGFQDLVHYEEVLNE